MLSVERGRPRRPAAAPPRRLQFPVVHLDGLAVFCLAVLVALGVANLDALGGRSLAEHQMAVLLGGVALFFVLHRFRSASLPWVGWTCYGLSVVLLVVVDVAGSAEYGARRWLAVGSFTLQPSELAKVALILVLADVLGSERSWPRRLLLALGLATVPIALVVTEPDLSTATVLTTLTIAMLVLGGIPWRALAALAGTVALAAPLVEHMLQPYQLDRLHAYFSGSRSADGPGWTILQAHIALAWGGLSGQARDPLHHLLASYLPARETDLAFASLIEQWGIVAGVVAVAAAAGLVWRLAAASRYGRTRSAGLAAAGLAVLIGIEVAVSVAANLGVIPTAGVPFPLLSYGGTAAAVHVATVGIILGLRTEAERRHLWLPPMWQRSRPRLVRLSSATVSLMLVGLLGFAWNLQVANGDHLRRAGLTQMTRCIRIPATRGLITDRHGVPLAVNVARSRVWLVHGLLRDADVPRLAALTGRSPTALRRMADAHSDSLTVDTGTVPANVGARVRAAHLPGVIVVQDPSRRYVYGGLLGTVLGWTGVATVEDMKRWPDLPLGAIVGRAGLEQQYDALLRGVDGRRCMYVDPVGSPVAMASYRAPVAGPSLRLSLDLGLQQRLARSLATHMHADGGDLGGAVIMDPRDGQVLAMASAPSYDDNVYGPPVRDAALARLVKRSGNPMLNHVTQVAAPPGSTFKPVVAAANLRTRHPVVSPDETVPTGAAWTLGGHTFHNWTALPAQNLEQAIAWSNDVYFYKLAWQLGEERIVRTARALGVGRPTGIDLPGESAGYLGTPKTVGKIGATWYPGSTVLLGIGQGYLTTTPLQDARWTSAVATGRLVTPHLGLAYGDTRAGYQSLTPFSVTKVPFSSRLGPVRRGLRQVVTNGTALMLQQLPVPAGGKTGTAEDPTAPGTGDDSWLSALAPFDPGTGEHPVVEATAMVHGGNGHETSTEIVTEVLQYFFRHERTILATASR